MGIVSRFFNIFKHKDLDKVTGAENNTADDNISPLVVQANQNVEAMVRADEFKEGALTPEEYTVNEDEEDVFEEVRDGGIVVEEGDDMSPIIMDEHNEMVAPKDIDKVINDPFHKHDVVENPYGSTGKHLSDLDGTIEIL